MLTLDVEQFLIVNHSITQVKQLPKSPIIIRDVTLLCAGFGYDFLTDDYKVILGDHTCFQVLSLISNVWKVIQFEYTFTSQVGLLCNGALHWPVYERP